MSSEWLHSTEDKQMIALIAMLEDVKTFFLLSNEDNASFSPGYETLIDQHGRDSTDVNFFMKFIWFKNALCSTFYT